MKLVTYLSNHKEKIGVVLNNEVVDVTNLYSNMNEIIQERDLSCLEKYVEAQSGLGNKEMLDDVILKSPITDPVRNIICIGWNYLKHFEERHNQEIQLPDKPTVFTKATKSVTGPYDEILYAEDVTQVFDYEAELAVVIGKEGRNIPREQTKDYIFGYMCANDLSARDRQFAYGGQWFVGKSLDNSCPLGPWLVTREEIQDDQSLDIQCRVNGEVVQSSNTKLMIFPIDEIISELSKVMTLLPGDIILTGTPSGVGFKRNPPLTLKEGDVVEVSISGIGNISNKIRTIKNCVNQG